MYINDIDTLKKYEKVSEDLSFASISPYENISLTKYFHKFMSQDLIDQIYGWATEANGTVERRCFEFFMGSLARLSIFESIASGEIQYGDGGITRTDNTHQKSAFAGQIRRYSNTLENNAYHEINELIDLMNSEPNIVTEWPGSPGSLLNEKYLIRTSKEFLRYQRLFRPYSTFAELVPSMETQQDFYLYSAFDKDLINELIENDALNEDRTELRTYLVKALVKFTLALGIENGLIKLSSEGARIIEHDEETSKSLETKPDLSSAAYQIRKLMDIGHRYVNQAQKFIEDNPGEFPPPEGDDCPEPPKHPHIVVV